MDGRLDDDIRAHATAFLDGKLAFEAFEDWLVSSTWDLRRGDHPESAALPFGLLGAITRYKEGEISEAELRREVEAELRAVTSHR